MSNSDDLTPANLDQKLVNELACTYPSFYSCVPWLAKTMDASTRQGARGCSPRIVKACGGARTCAVLEFGRCLDSGTSFSNGVSAHIFERMLHCLSTCTSWTSVRQWEPVDEFTFLCKLPSLGESCVVMQNTYPSSRTHIHVEYCRRSIESERLLMTAKYIEGGTAMTRQTSDGVQNVGVTPALLNHTRIQSQQYIDAMLKHHETAGSLPAHGTSGPFVPFVDAQAVAQLIGVNASAIAVASNIKEQDAVQQSQHSQHDLQKARDVPDPQGQHCPMHRSGAHDHVGFSARREKEIRAAATATITKNLLLRTADYALRDTTPFDMRARIVRDIPVTHRTLKDLMEPARSEMCLRKVFNYGDPMSITTPAWSYEIKLNWSARGITQAERLQRTSAPRCTVSIRILNAPELLLSGGKSSAQLAALMLQKAVQLQNAALHAPVDSSEAAVATFHVLDAHQVYGRV